MQAFTTKQKRYIDVFMRQINESLNVYIASFYEKDTGLSLDTVLENSSTAVDVISAGVVVGGLAAAPATLGTSLAAAGACIVLLQTGSACAKIVRRYADNKDAPMAPDETKYDELQLSILVFFREVADLAALRYRHYIDTFLEEKGINEFAHYGAERVMKKLFDVFKTQKNTDLSNTAEFFVDFLMESVTLSTLHPSQRVTLKPAKTSSSLLTSPVAYAKWGYARPRVAFYTLTPQTLSFKFYASTHESSYLRRDSTLKNYGYITLQTDQFLPETHVNNRKLSLQDSATLESEIKPYFCIYFPVTKAHISEYLTEINQASLTSTSLLTLNDFLSKKLGAQVIAECHDDELKGLDLSKGNYSEVNFRYANLSNCNLELSIWTEAHVENAVFVDTLQQGAIFHHLYAEKTEWGNVTFIGDYTHAKMNGAKIKQCNNLIGLAQHVGIKLELAELEDVKIEELQYNFNERIEARLTQEHIDRVQLKNELTKLSERCDQYAQAVVHATDVVIIEEQEIQLLHHDIAELESKHNKTLIQMNYQFIDLQKQCDLLMSVIQHDETIQKAAIEQIKQWQRTQEDTNQLLLSRIAVIEKKPIQDILKNLNFVWESVYNTSTYQRLKSLYIDLDVLPGISTGFEKLPLWDRLEQFLEDDSEQVLLLHGELGAGKSLSTVMWQEELMLKYQTEHDWLPITIKLKQVQHAIHDNFLITALKTILDSDQVIDLIENFKCFITLDGLDECPIVLLRHILEDCLATKGQWKKGFPKILLTAQTRFLLEKNYRELLRLSPTEKFPLTSESVIQPFTEAQITQYLRPHYIEDGHFFNLFWTFKEHEKAIKRMAKSPIMLHIICEVLHALKPGDPLPTSRSEFYNAFLSNWVTHIREKLPNEDITYADIQFYIQQLAFEMFIQGSDFIEIPYHTEKKDLLRSEFLKETDKDHHNSLMCLFENPLLQRVSYEVPVVLTIIGGMKHYEFSHANFKHYALANKLLEILADLTLSLKEKGQHWNHQFLTDTPSVLDFMNELLNHNPNQTELHRILLMIVLLSKGDVGQEFARAASNAISLLARQHYNFSEKVPGSNLINIHIPKADLSGALLAYIQLTRSDLSSVNFHEANLAKACLQETNLTNTRFLNAVSVMYTDKCPETVAIYPSLREKIIAYDVYQDHKIKKFNIIIARASDGYVFATLDGHMEKILCMAWGVSNGKARLASAGEGKTVRVWELSNSDMTETKDIGKFQEHTGAILNLAWARNGNLLASSSEDRTVRIWDVDAGKCIFTSPEHAFIVNNILWGQVKSILVSGCFNGILRYWDVSSPNSNLVEFELKKLIQAINNQTGMSSTALSADDEFIASGYGNGAICLRELSTRPSIQPAPRILLGHSDIVTSLVWNEHRLISGSKDTTVRVWDTKGDICLNIFHGHENSIKKVALFANGHHLISGGGSKNQMFYIWSTASPSNGQISDSDIAQTVTSPDPQGHFIASGGIYGIVSLWDIRQLPHKTVKKIIDHKSCSVLNLCWSPNGQKLASLGKDSVIYIYDKRLDRTCNTIKLDKAISFNHMIWLNKTEYTLACGASDGSVYTWTLNQASELIESTVFPAIQASVQNIACSPNGGLLAICGGNHIYICTANAPNNTNQQLLFGDKKQRFIKLAWSPDGRFLASTQSDFSIFIWDTTSWTRLKTYKNQNHVLWANVQDKQYLILGTSDETTIIDTNATPNWRTPIKRLDIGATLLNFNAPYLFFVYKKSIQLLNFLILINEDSVSNPWIAVLGNELWVQGCRFDRAQFDDANNDVSASKSNQRLLTEHGAKGAIIKEESPGFFSSLFAPTKTILKLPPPDDLSKRPRPRSARAKNGFFSLTPSSTQDISSRRISHLDKTNSRRRPITQTETVAVAQVHPPHSLTGDIST